MAGLDPAIPIRDAVHISRSGLKSRGTYGAIHGLRSERAAARWRWSRRTRCVAARRRAGRAADNRDQGDPHHRRHHHDRPLAEIGGKGLFTKEIEQALLDGAIDVAVHSAKDIPGFLPDGLVLAVCLPREDARDVFISRKADEFAALPRGAVVGTASPRRQAMVKRLRPDLAGGAAARQCRDAAARSSTAGEADATLLAMAGLNRLGLAKARATALIDSTISCRRSAQGVIAHRDARGRCARPATCWRDRPCRRGDRAAGRARVPGGARGSCRTPIAGHAAHRRRDACISVA